MTEDEINQLEKISPKGFIFLRIDDNGNTRLTVLRKDDEPALDGYIYLLNLAMQGKVRIEEDKGPEEFR